MAELGEESAAVTVRLRQVSEQRERARQSLALIVGYQETSIDTIAMAEAWLPLGNEAWQRHAPVSGGGSAEDVTQWGKPRRDDWVFDDGSLTHSG